MLKWTPTFMTRRDEMPESRNPFAVITGASSGFGYHLARMFGEHGFDLFVTSATARIEGAGKDLELLGFKAQCLEADLASYEGVEKLWKAIQQTGRPIDAIAIDAELEGDFARETGLSDELKLVELSVTSTLHLAKRALPQMVARGQGRILFASSIAGVMPASLDAVYGASHAFVRSLAQSLRKELKGTGITVLALEPEPADVDLAHGSGGVGTDVCGKCANDPAEVARLAYEALMQEQERDHVQDSALTSKRRGKLVKFVPAVRAERHMKLAQQKHRKR
jgi:uncharacterized protein